MSCPSGKRRFATESYAKAQLVGAIMRRNRGNQKRQERRVYECPLCHGWHLTKIGKPKR